MAERDRLEVPDLLDLQIQSFQWLVGDEAWFQRRIDAGDENPVGGLEEILTGWVMGRLPDGDEEVARAERTIVDVVSGGLVRPTVAA